LLSIHLVKRRTGGVPGNFVVHPAENAATDNFETLQLADRLPHGFQSTKGVLESIEGCPTAFPTDLDVARGEACDDDAVLASTSRLRQILDKCHVAVKSACRQTSSTE